MTTPMRTCDKTITGGWTCTLDYAHKGDHAHICYTPNGVPYTVAFWEDGAARAHVIREK